MASMRQAKEETSGIHVSHPLRRFPSILVCGMLDYSIFCMIDTDQKLTELLPRLGTAEWVALDTEADSLHAYPEKLCLLQISIAGVDELLDPLAQVDYAPLWKSLKKHELILHGADYDLRLLRRHFGFVPSAIFDTMLASRLLGIREFGLTDLLFKFLGIKLEKGPQKANWARRPLTERMETYARNDTHYLKPLADLLRWQLKERDRLAWHQETCAQLVDECAQPRATDPDEAWRVKGSQILDPPALAVLREVWHWREKEAIRVNKPPFFILSPDWMVQIARGAVDTQPVADLLPHFLSSYRREGILKAVGKALEMKKFPSKNPRPMSHRQTEAERRRMHDLQKRRNQKATELDLDPTLIASRSMLVLLARDWEAHREELMNWQRQLLEPSVN
jgi:ribonuclease D